MFCGRLLRHEHLLLIMAERGRDKLTDGDGDLTFRVAPSGVLSQKGLAEHATGMLTPCSTQNIKSMPQTIIDSSAGTAMIALDEPELSGVGLIQILFTAVETLV